MRRLPEKLKPGQVRGRYDSGNGNMYGTGRHKTKRSRFETLDNVIHNSARGGLVLFGTLSLLSLITMVAGIIGAGVILNSRPAPVPTVVTVMTASRDLDGEAWADAKTPTGKQVLLHGKFVPGDKVDAYPWERSDAPNAEPLYGTSAPWYDGGGYLLGAFLGFLAGFVLWPLLAGGYLLTRWIVTRRQRKSEEIINAVLR